MRQFRSSGSKEDTQQNSPVGTSERPDTPAEVAHIGWSPATVGHNANTDLWPCQILPPTELRDVPDDI